ncbi:GntR family transcriptional regulator [Nisaea acidiphila]|uniref:GntR family transcriptional regulator n=1 Tax=Nisaea acidiphila TaxID=1862145 RepID=A0A9J7AWX3_9PROT|nr:GntR family transcriptional regulator [Nisaea acidiphila]UUX49949.1 GntR family transcriptional regulator [Nisaea acidiphila]
MSAPLYKYVIETLIERIASGELAPGIMLPSEGDLGAELGVSQGTARKALSELERRGIVSRRQGVGTFVTARTPESALFHFFRLRDADGSQVSPVLEDESVQRRRALKPEREVLFGNPDSVYEIERVRSVRSERVVHERSIVPAGLFPGLPERNPLPNTLYVLYQRAYSVAIVQASEAVRAVTGMPDVCRQLSVPDGTPLLRVERRAADLAGRVVELRISHFVTGDRFYAVDLA